MNDSTDICCNGNCRQGRDCPLTAKHPRSMDEAFGTNRFDPYEWHEERIPFLARSVVAAAVLLVLVCYMLVVVL
jgi:hypothetical protein